MPKKNQKKLHSNAKNTKEQKKPSQKSAANNKSAPAGKRGARSAQPTGQQGEIKQEQIFPNRFPFWARLKIYKNRTTLVIDETPVRDKHKKKTVDGFVHREATHTKGQGESIIPNPDKGDPKPMYLKNPSKLPKRLFKPHNKDLDMPEDLRQRYEKNNHKCENGNDSKKT